MASKNYSREDIVRGLRLKATKEQMRRILNLKAIQTTPEKSYNKAIVKELIADPDLEIPDWMHDKCKRKVQQFRKEHPNQKKELEELEKQELREKMQEINEAIEEIGEELGMNQIIEEKVEEKAAEQAEEIEKTAEDDIEEFFEEDMSVFEEVAAENVIEEDFEGVMSLEELEAVIKAMTKPMIITDAFLKHPISIEKNLSQGYDLFYRNHSNFICKTKTLAEAYTKIETMINFAYVLNNEK